MIHNMKEYISTCSWITTWLYFKLSIPETKHRVTQPMLSNPGPLAGYDRRHLAVYLSICLLRECQHGATRGRPAGQSADHGRQCHADAVGEGRAALRRTSAATRPLPRPLYPLSLTTSDVPKTSQRRSNLQDDHITH